MRKKNGNRNGNSKNPRVERFDPAAFLETAALGRSLSTHRKNQIIFSQGDAADSVIYIKKGKIKVTVVSQHGKEAVVLAPCCSQARLQIPVKRNCCRT